VQGISIGSLAKSAGVRIDTVRHYERIGLMPAPARTDAGYRSYGAEDRERLRFIRRGRDLGFTLTEIGQLLALKADTTASAADVLAITQTKIADLRTRIDDLSIIESALTQLADACPPDAPIDDCPILLHLFAVAHPHVPRLSASLITKE
jgi:DNA-binding transcriptional MerR regulator